jgi:hypothetical protein
MSFFGRMRVAQGEDLLKADADRTEDGKFKLGPANAQRKQGDAAFQAAKDHVDNAASCARAGDEQGADFHVGMAQQYAALGCKNHLMGDYVDKTKAKKAEHAPGDVPLRKDWAAYDAQRGGGENAGKTYSPEHGWESDGEKANRQNPHPGKKATAATPEEWKKGNDTGGANFKQANELNSAHYAMGNYHHDKMLDHDTGPVAQAHYDANGAHGEAQHYAYLAGQSYMAGQKSAGDDNLTRALQAGKSAYEATGRATMAELTNPKKK